MRFNLVAELGYAYALSGRTAEALPLLEQAVELATSMNRVAIVSLHLGQLSEAYLLADRREDAIACAGRALGVARGHGERGHEAWALRLHGEIAAHAQDASGNAGPAPETEQAEEYYHQAIALADELGMRPLVAHCHLGLGTLYQKIGRQDRAHAELAAAAELYRAMEMPFWLAKAETALEQLAH